MSVYDLARPEIRDLAPYSAALPPADFVRLNANEMTVLPYAGADVRQELNRYPEMRPLRLRGELADLFGVAEQSLCPTRGSSEGIDLLVRTFCRAYTDNVVVLPPTFEMYAAYAAMQGADVRTVPLREPDFAVDWKALSESCDARTKIVFLCSPNNPTGNLLDVDRLLDFVRDRRERSIVVVDEAYVEFSGRPSLAGQIGSLENLVVLRTLSKAFALAGIRCGAVIGSPSLVRMVAAMMSPYAISTPATIQVLDALAADNRKRADELVRATVAERQRLQAALGASAAISTVWPSEANFVLVRPGNAERLRQALEKRRVMVREFGSGSALQGLVRISVGTAAENDRLLAAVAACEDN